MNIDVYSSDLTLLMRVGGMFSSCYWLEGYNTEGMFTLELPASSLVKAHIKPDCYIKRSDRDTVMVVKSVQINGNVLTATGKTATRVLKDVAFIGTIPAGSVISQSLVNAYSASNKFPHVNIGTSNLTDTYKHQISHKSMLELYEVMCQSEDVGYKAVKSGTQIEIRLYKPTLNPNLIFAPEYGNLVAPILSLSTENYKNYAIVLGGGEEQNRKRIDVDMADNQIRRELIVDARDIQLEEGETEADYNARLYARGVEKLLEQTKTWNVLFTPLANQFGQRFDLGDILTVNLNEYNLKIQSRITKYALTEQRGKSVIEIGVGEPTIMRR